MSLFLKPVRFRSRTTGLPMTVHSTWAFSTVTDRVSHFMTEHGYALSAAADDVTTTPFRDGPAKKKLLDKHAQK